MRVLILTQYYPPEMGAPQNRLSSLARHLAASGHTVTVLTAFPHYPSGVVNPEYRGLLTATEHLEGCRVVRTWVFATPRKTFVPRMLNYLSFTASSLLIGAWKVGRQDVLLAESPPLFLGFSGWVLSLLKRAAMVFNVSDLWPASAVALGVLRSGALVGLSEALEIFLYRHSRMVFGQTRGIVEDIQRRVPGTRVELVTNGVDLESYVPDRLLTLRGDFRRAHGLEDRFVVGYAGLHGIAYDFDSVLEAAELLRSVPSVVFLLVGDGPAKAATVRQAKAKGLSNVRFLPVQPRSDVPKVVAAMDCAILPLRRLDLLQGALPSKMFEAMGAGVPLVLGVEGEARRLVESAGAGVCIEPENPQALAAAIQELARDRTRAAALGAAGRALVLRDYDRAAIARRVETLLVKTLEQQPHS